MAVNTTNYKFNKPVVGADSDSWGGELNENWDKVDSLLYGASYTDGDSQTVERIQPDLEQGSWAVNGTVITATATQLNNIPSAITGGATTIASSNLTAGRALISDSNGKVAVSSTITTTELGYLNNVSSNIQTQLNGKQSTITGAATTIDGSDLTVNRAVISNASGKVAVSAVTSTELGYLDGVSSSIQTQINGKLSTGGGTLTGSLIVGAGNQLYSNTISEVSSNTGVTIDSVLLKDDTVTADSHFISGGTGGHWEIVKSGTTLQFKNGSTVLMTLDDSGNLSVAGNVNSNATL